jgi:predicted TPR repeat methyltransferase
MAVFRQLRQWLSALRRVSRVVDYLPPVEIGATYSVDYPLAWSEGAHTDKTTDEMYRAFADVFRGPVEEIALRQNRFVPYFRDAVEATNGRPVVDIGAGRGETLGLLRDAGIPAVGVEVSQVACRELRAAGFDVRNTDANSFLHDAADASVACIVAYSVIEHFDTGYLMDFLHLAARKIAPGGCIVLESNNALAQLGFGAFWMDYTHQHPYHQDVLAFYLSQLGFVETKCVYTSPVPVGLRVQHQMQYNYHDYTVIGLKPLCG